MADKEATVYLIDLGSSMGECHNGRTESDLDWSLRYVWDKICTTVAASRKQWTIGVVGLRTDETNNHLQEDDGYENISILQEVGPMSMSELRSLQSRVRQSHTMQGDAISAIILATDMIDRAAPQRLKFKRKIILVTDGQGPIDDGDADDIKQVAIKINDLGIELVVIGVDFDDKEYGFKEEDKPSLKAKNEALLASMVDQCTNGVFGTMAEAIQELDMPRIKATRPYKSYDGPLSLGDPKEYESAISINVERYFTTKLARPVPASTTVIKAESGHGGTQSTQTVDAMEGLEFASSDLAAVRQVRSYKVANPNIPGGKEDVEFEKLAKGYEYGRTAVHISESDHNITRLETTKDFSIIGFIPQERFEPFLSMGETCVILPRKFSEEDELALSALVHALYELDSYAVARYVGKDGKDPQLLLLAPSIEPDLECLHDVPLPFAEDVRQYQFPPLDKVLTITGSVLTKHRLLPSDDLNQAMSDYVDAMDISTFGKDEDGNPEEYATTETIFSPIIHRVNQAIRFRAIHPDEPFQLPASEVLARFEHPPERLVEASSTQVDALVSAADVKKVPPKVKGKRNRDTITPLSGLDVDALLFAGSTKKAAKISEENSIPEFKQVLRHKSREEADIEQATQQLSQIIQSFISTSTGDIMYDRAVENIRVMREELIEVERYDLYNKFVRDLKAKLAAEELGGPRLDMWWKIRWAGLGLITGSESEESNVTEEEAETFLRYIKPTTALPTR